MECYSIYVFDIFLAANYNRVKSGQTVLPGVTIGDYAVVKSVKNHSGRKGGML